METDETASHVSSNHMLIRRYCNRSRLCSLCWISLQRQGKFLEERTCLNLILWIACLTFSCTIIFMKKSSHMFILSLKGIPQFTFSMPAKRQGSISISSARGKNIRVDCYEIKTVYLIFEGGGEGENDVYGGHYCPLSQQGK